MLNFIKCKIPMRDPAGLAPIQQSSRGIENTAGLHSLIPTYRKTGFDVLFRLNKDVFDLKTDSSFFM